MRTPSRTPAARSRPNVEFVLDMGRNSMGRVPGLREDGRDSNKVGATAVAHTPANHLGTTMSIRDLPRAEIQKRIDRIHWHHEFDFGEGLRAEVTMPDADSHRGCGA